jgi:hypothetical protein
MNSNVRMYRLRHCFAALVFLLPFASLAGSLPDPLNPNGIVIVPATPTAGQAFVVRWDAPDCVDIRALRAATLTGSHLQVDVEYIIPLPGLPGCTPGVTRRHEWTVGPFPAGTYDFELLNTA